MLSYRGACQLVVPPSLVPDVLQHLHCGTASVHFSAGNEQGEYITGPLCTGIFVSHVSSVSPVKPTGPLCLNIKGLRQCPKLLDHFKGWQLTFLSCW